ncbi:MAG: phosphoenolpyruvate synthase [Nanoarchaeota archaeon]|nr:phosphoenolpyruvate synthase [Nanoarchaeota archaeon]
MADNSYTIRLEEIDKTNRKVGGKGANLGELVKAGFPVPKGFAVTTDAYEVFVRANKLNDKIQQLLSGLDVDDNERLNEVSLEIQEMMLNAEVPDFVKNAVKDEYENISVGRDLKNLGGVAFDLVKTGRGNEFVAVRSSATAEDLSSASFAGQMNTILNVSGVENLMQAIKRCWASLFTSRVIFYRKNKGFDKIPSMGVVVQKMINSDKAGVVFTADPTTNDDSKIVIESAWGLGEVVVSGIVTPDEYIIEKETGQIVNKRAGKKVFLRTRNGMTGNTVQFNVPKEDVMRESLNDNEIKKIWELSRKVETHYNGQPQDIEWCIEKNRLYFVQARPITTLRMEAKQEKEITGDEKIILEGIAASPGVVEGRVRIVAGMNDLNKIERGDILVATMTSPAMIPAMKRAAAIITDEGGRTSHAATVSRELGIPCIVGTERATELLKDGDLITLDAVHGKIYQADEKPDAQDLAETYENFNISEDMLSSSITGTKIRANVSTSYAAEKAIHTDGIGLLTAENILTESGKHPVYLARTNPEELIETIVREVGSIARVMHPKPVWYRSLDAYTDEFRELRGGEEEPNESNPILGWHGIRRSLTQPEVFRCEIEALRRLKEHELNNIAIILPFVSSVEEIRRAKEFLTFPIKLGVMIETPAAIVEIEKFCKEGIDFALIASHSLAQLTLGVDRNNTRIANLYSESHPAIMTLIEHAIKVCKKHRVEISICGEVANNPYTAEKLVEMGIDSISVESDAIDTIKDVVARTERKLLLDRARNSKSF